MSLNELLISKCLMFPDNCKNSNLRKCFGKIYKKEKKQSRDWEKLTKSSYKIDSENLNQTKFTNEIHKWCLKLFISDKSEKNSVIILLTDLCILFYHFLLIVKCTLLKKNFSQFFEVQSQGGRWTGKPGNDREFSVT